MYSHFFSQWYDLGGLMKQKTLVRIIRITSPGMVRVVSQSKTGKSTEPPSRNTIWNQDLLEISRGFQTQLGCRIFSVLKIFAYPHGLLYTVPCISMVHGSIKYKVNSRNSKAIIIPNNICTYLSLTATSQPRGYLTTCLNTPFLAF